MISSSKNCQRLAFWFLLIASADAFGQQDAQKSTSSDVRAKQELKAPLGLPRLKVAQKPGKAPGLPATAYKLDPLDLASGDSASVVQRGSVKVVQLESAREWTRPLIKKENGPIYISFLLYASEGSLVAIDGAWIGVVPSNITGICQLVVGIPGPKGLAWRETGVNALTQTYNGERLTEFPVITVRLDPVAGVWDLYVGPKLVTDSIILERTNANQANSSKFWAQAGKGRVWIAGLVQSTENPLFEDSNENGIDDDFEKGRGAGLLSAKLSPAQRSLAAKEWQNSTKVQRVEAWLVDKVRPDTVSAAPDKQ